MREVWAAFRSDGIAGVLELAADDAWWRPHSAHKRSFRSTAEYREHLAQTEAAGERVEARATGIWSHGELVVVRGRMRIRGRGGLLEDTRMYWLFGVRDRRLVARRVLAGSRRHAARRGRARPGAGARGVHRAPSRGAARSRRRLNPADAAA